MTTKTGWKRSARVLRLSVVPAVLAVLMSAGCTVSPLHDDRQDAINLSGSVEYYVDRTGQRSFEAVLAAPAGDLFEPNGSSSLMFGVSDNVNWVRFRWADLPRVSSDPTAYTLYLTFSGFGDVRLYEPDAQSRRPETDGERYTVLQGGSNLEEGTAGVREPARSMFPSFRLDDDIDREEWVYLRVEMPYSANFRLKAVEQDLFARTMLRTIALPLVLVGMLVVLTLYHVMVYATTRRPSSLAYALYLLIVVPYLLAVSGLARVAGPVIGDVITRNALLLAFLIGGLYTLFAWFFLRVGAQQRLMRSAYYAFWALDALGVVLHVLSLAAFPWLVLTVNRFAFSLTLLLPILVISSLFGAYRRNIWVSVFYRVAVGILMTNLVVYLFRGFGLLPHSPITQYSLFLFVPVEALMASLAVAAGVRRLRLEKHEAVQRERSEYIARRIAEDSAHAKSDFLARMSHEIRSPLNGVIGFSELLSRTPLTDLQQRYIHRIMSASELLLDTVNEVLDVSRMEAGRLQLEYVKTDVVKLVEDTIGPISYSASEKKLELLLSVDPEIPRYCWCDPVRLRQVLANLLSNAVKFTERGEVELRVGFDRVDVERGSYHFMVRDTGIGMNEEAQSRVFGAFAQADPVGSDRREFSDRRSGSGLGLYIVRGLVERMGGRIALHSEPGQGSRFCFDLATEYVYDSSDRADCPAIPDVSEVLVVAHNAGAAGIASRMFQWFNARADTRQDGASALAYLRRFGPVDLLVLDYRMPDLGGHETLRLIRNELNAAVRPKHVVVLHEVKDSWKEVEESIRVGADAAVLKPLLVDQVRAAVGGKLHLMAAIGGDVGAATAEKPIDEREYRIVVADDHEMNRELLETALNDFFPNSHVYPAVDGGQAVDRAVQLQADIVLMDLQMQVTDGYRAIRSIRSARIGEKRRCRIIAFSAATNRREREAAAAAGADAFLPKPLTRAALREVLSGSFSRALEAGGRDDTLQGCEEAVDEVREAAYGVAGIDMDEALESAGGDHERLRERLHRFVSEYSQVPDTLQRQLQQRDYRGVRASAHGLAGVAGGMGATSVYALGRRMVKLIDEHSETKSNGATAPDLHANEQQELMRSAEAIEVELRRIADSVSQLPPTS